MATRIQRWGNSLAIRIPKAFAEQADIAENAEVEIFVEGDRIVIAPAKAEWNLSDLLRQVTPANRYHETNWGTSKGKEVW